MKYLFLLVFLLGCGNKNTNDFIEKIAPKHDPRDIKTTNPIFYPYIDKFRQDCNITTTTPVGFGNLESLVAGKCKWWISDLTNKVTYKQITIDINSWERFDESSREWLIFHELGHCELGRNHKNEVFENGYPKSIMKSQIPYDLKTYYLDYKHYWVRELCGKDFRVKAIIVYHEFDSPGLYTVEFESEEEAREYLEIECFDKEAVLILGDNLETEDHM